MLQHLNLSPRAQRLLPPAVAALVCLTGTVVLARVLGAHYPVQQWLIWRLAPIWAYTLLFNAACVAMGAFALRRVLGDRPLPALERLLQSMVAGLTLFVLALYALGFIGLFRPWAALLLPAIFLGVGYRELLRLFRGVNVWRAQLPELKLLGKVGVGLAFTFGVTALFFMYLEALDVSAFNFDATWYHYPTAQDYARLGRIVPFPGENHRAYPHLTALLHTWGLLVPGLPRLPQHWMLSLHLEYSIVLWRIVGVAALCHWLLGARLPRGLWAGFFLFPSIFIYDQNIGGSADHYLGFYACPIVLAAARALRGFDWRHGVLLGAALGGHMLVKYQALYLVFALGLVTALRLGFLLLKSALRRFRKREPAVAGGVRTLAIGALAIAGSLLLVSAPHFLKNAVFYGNPAYPFAQSTFAASYPKHEPGYYRETPHAGTFAPKYQGLERQAWVAAHLFDYSFKTANRGLTQRRPYMGALFSLLLPCVLFVAGRRRLAFALSIGIVAFWVWANTSANDRYALGFYDLFIATALALMVRVWELGWLGRAGLVPLVGVQLLWGGDAMWVYGRKRLDAALDLIGAGYAEQYDAKRFAARSIQQQITRGSPPDAKILARNYKNLLGLDRMVLSDIRTAQDYISYSNLKDARELYELLRSRGITHLLYPPGQRKPARWNNVILWDELFLRHARKLKRFGGVSFAELPEEPPPMAAPYLVFVRGVREYPDGVYAVEQLDVDERWPQLFSPRPKPLHPLAKEDPDELMAGVQAVVLGRKDASLRSVGLQRDFESVERFTNAELLLRRRGH